MSFEALKADLAAMNKSLAVGTTEGETTPNADAAPGASTDATDGGALLGKSFSFELADGTVIEAVDGAELVKSLGDRLVGNEQAFAKSQAESLELMTAQNELLKSLTAQVAALSGTGAGRRSVLRSTESIPASNSRPGAVQDLAKSLTFKTGKEAMDAAEAAYTAGRISSVELAMCESFMGKAMQFPADLAKKVVGV